MSLDPTRFPNLTTYAKTSDETFVYNCIAYACGLTDRWIWPGMHWPPGFRLSASVDTFRSVLAKYGFQLCADDALEDGIEKIAIYTIGNDVKHAARQLPSGEWSSKLGGNIDITHPDLKALEGPAYGKVLFFMRRPRPATTERLRE